MLLGVALTQACLALVDGFAPWKGGSFGMFSSLDYGSNRRFHAQGVDESGALVEVNLFSERDQRRHARLRVWPSRHALEPFADELLASEFVPDVPEEIKLRAGLANGWMLERFLRDRPPERPPIFRRRRPEEPGSGRIIRLKALRLSLWKKRFDAADSRLLWQPVGPTIVKGRWP